MSMQNRHHHHVLPPYVLEALRQNADPAAARQAARTLEVDRSVRAARSLLPVRPAPGPERVEEPAAGDGPNPPLSRTISDAGNTEDLPGRQIRAEAEPSNGDVACDEAYDGLGDTFKLYWELFSRNSIDGNGLPLKASIHYGQDYDNAFWDGERMIFGDGDGTYFNRFTISVDVIGHELTHGVTGAEVNLTYEGQSGALNESVSDVFGSLVKQYAADPQRRADEADWLIGEGLFTDRVQGVALRSMKAPGTAFDDPVIGKDPQPASMADYVDTTDDNGGVHINSGIPNRAFYLAAVGLGGYAWEKAGKIWYETIRDASLSAEATFAEFAAVTIAQAQALFDDAAAAVVRSAWTEVGVDVPADTSAEPDVEPDQELDVAGDERSNVELGID
jgi:Zn-dependent metalloprotease